MSALFTQLRGKLKQVNLFYRLNVALQGYFQELEAARSLAWYKREAERSGIQCPEGAPLFGALKERLKTRARHRWPCSSGNLHIFLAYAVANWESILPKALAPFGRVTVFDWRRSGFDDWAADWLSRRDLMNAAMLDAFCRANQKQPVDIAVGYLSGHNTSPQTLKKMAEDGAAIYNFCWDDKLNFPGKPFGGRYPTTAALASVVDLNLTNSPESLVKYAVHGGLAMFWPEAAHPDHHKPCDLPFEYDVSFAGARYGWRPAFIDKLRRYGIKVESFGKGWPNGPLSDEDMIKLYSRSRINLGFEGVGYSRKIMCLKGRDFEVPMSGGLYLTQNNPDLSRVYDVGREIMVYEDEADCAKTILELLNAPERAARIRQAGRERALREHTYEARWKLVLRSSGILE